ncbi:MAG: AIR synthase-related protein, partial [Sciscionella sp.]
DVSGTGVGVVNADAILGPERVCPGDVLIAMGSSGLHANGYSLVRHVLENAALPLDATPPECDGRTMADELLVPTRIYALDCLALAREVGVHAFAHVTGGGLAGNLARVLPPDVTAVVHRDSWAPQPIFGLLARAGDIARQDLELTFNLGVGMLAVVPPERAENALALLAARDVAAWRCGEVTAAEPGATSVRLAGDYRGEATTWR